MDACQLVRKETKMDVVHVNCPTLKGRSLWLRTKTMLSSRYLGNAKMGATLGRLTAALLRVWRSTSGQSGSWSCFR